MATTKSGSAHTSADSRPKKDQVKFTPQGITDAYAEWKHQQQEASLAYQRQCTEAYFKLINAVNEITTAAQKPIEAAHHKLMVASSTANLNQERWQNYQQLQQEFAKVMLEFNNDPARQESIQKAYQNYTDATQRALEDAHNSNMKAYQKYLSVLKGAWSQIDIEGLTPVDMQTLEWSTKVAFHSGA